MVARGKKESTLYMMQAKLCKGEVNAVKDSSTELWHKRLGHMSEKGLDILAETPSYERYAFVDLHSLFSWQTT